MPPHPAAAAAWAGVFWVWPLPVALPVYGVIAGLSAWFYWYVLKAMHRPVMTGKEEMSGAIGRVLEVGRRGALVRVHSELWNAESDDALRPADWVEVLKVSGLRLTVRRLGDQDPWDQMTGTQQPNVSHHEGVTFHTHSSHIHEQR